MNWLHSILGRPPQTNVTTESVPTSMTPAQVLYLIADGIDADRIVLDLDARAALAKVTGAVARQDRRKLEAR